MNRVDAEVDGNKRMLQLTVYGEVGRNFGKLESHKGKERLRS